MYDLCLIGLGNPGSKFDQTKHNVGKDWLVELAKTYSLVFEEKKKYEASISSSHENKILWVIPNNYMNNSGVSVSKVMKNKNLDPKNIILMHDDLDLGPGDVRFKIGGGHGGHNGLKDIFHRTSSREFSRVRIGIGHPGMKSEVNKWVLNKFNPTDKHLIDKGYKNFINVFDDICNKKYAEAQKKLHTS